MARDRVYLFLRWSSLALLCLAAFWPMFRNGFVWDDPALITKDPAIRGLWPPGRFFAPQGSVAQGTIYPLAGQRPVMIVSLAIDYAIWKLNPFGYHLTNLILHFLCVGMVAFLVRTFSRSSKAGFLAGSLFALHPGHAEGVIAFLGRSDLLATAFVLAGFWMYGRYREGKGKILWYLGSLISYLAACFSKETGLVLLGVLILYEGLNLEGEPSQFQNPASRFIALLPFLAIALFYWGYRGKVLGGQASGTHWWGGSSTANCLMMFHAYLKYLQLLLAPFSLSPLHTVPVPGGLGDVRVLVGSILLLGTLGIPFYCWKHRPMISLWVGWFLLGLIPVANIIPIPGMILAERWIYLPSVGACALGGWGAGVIFERSRGGFRTIWIGMVILILVLLGVRTFLWNAVWKTEGSVARTIVATSPDSPIGWNNLGNASLLQGDLTGAEGQLLEALRLKPDYALAHNNLGNVFRHEGRVREAESEYRNSLKLNPDYADAHNNLGVVLSQMGRPHEAAVEFQKAILLKPDDPKVHYNLGLALGAEGLIGEASSEFRRTLQLNPGHADASYNLGIALGKLGRFSEAEQALRQAVRLKPDAADVYLNLGAALEGQGKYPEAVQVYRECLTHSPRVEDRARVEEKIAELEHRATGEPHE